MEFFARHTLPVIEMHIIVSTRRPYEGNANADPSPLTGVRDDSGIFAV
jgi:hypothetical protein